MVNLLHSNLSSKDVHRPMTVPPESIKGHSNVILFSPSDYMTSKLRSRSVDLAKQVTLQASLILAQTHSYQFDIKPTLNDVILKRRQQT